MKKIVGLFLAILASLSLISCSNVNAEPENVLNIVNEIIGIIDVESENGKSEEIVELDKIEEIIEEDGHYMAKEDVALYIRTYNKLPGNFIRKRDAEDLGWQSSKGNLWDVTDQKSIGGDKFGNREKLLPIKEGRTYYECDINYEGQYRGAERIVYSNDGLVYYTGDHYETFTLLYGDGEL